MTAHGLMFHHFHDDRHPRGQGAIDADCFERLLFSVGSERILSPDDWIRRVDENCLPPDALCLSFDDGLLCQYDVAVPILKRLNLRAFWFIYSGPMLGHPDRLEIYRFFRTTMFQVIDDFYDAFERIANEIAHKKIKLGRTKFNVETYLSQFTFYTARDRWFRFLRDELLTPVEYFSIYDRLIKEYEFEVERAAKGLWLTNQHIRSLHDDGHFIGLHSTSHPTRMARLSPDEQMREFRINYEHLADVTGRAPICMSHPCNSYDEHTLGILRRLGIRIGFRSNMAPIQAIDACLEFPREDHSNLARRYNLPMCQ